MASLQVWVGAATASSCTQQRALGVCSGKSFRSGPAPAAGMQCVAAADAISAQSLSELQAQLAADGNAVVVVQHLRSDISDICAVTSVGLLAVWPPGLAIWH
jgi:hypothetical protein